MKKNVLCALGLVMLSAGGVASAVQYTWNLSNPTNGTYSNGITYSSEGGSLNFTSTSGDKTLKVNAFRTSSSDGSGLLQDAKVTSDGNWGLGVLSGGEYDYPENLTLDNDGRDEVLVFDSQMANFDWSSLNLGFVYSGSELKYWTGNGGSSGFDFNNLCLMTSCSGQTLASMGFASATASGLSTGSSKDVTTQNGRYLVVSGQLPNSNGFEKFKISSVGGYGNAPEPQSMALIAIGILAMLEVRRRVPGARPRQGEVRFA